MGSESCQSFLKVCIFVPSQGCLVCIECTELTHVWPIVSAYNMVWFWGFFCACAQGPFKAVPQAKTTIRCPDCSTTAAGPMGLR